MSVSVTETCSTLSNAMSMSMIVIYKPYSTMLTSLNKIDRIININRKPHLKPSRASKQWK
jgi:hypothetical protein